MNMSMESPAASRVGCLCTYGGWSGVGGRGGGGGGPISSIVQATYAEECLCHKWTHKQG